MAYNNAIAACHPDRFSDDVLLGRQAQDMAARINRAWHTLAHPLQRAKHMLALVGVSDEDHTSSDSEFLMQQMDWQEKIEDAGVAARQMYAAELAQQQQATLASIADLFSGYWQDDDRIREIQQQLQRLQFWNKLLQQLDY